MARPKRASSHPYSVHPGVLMIQKWVTELPAKTGRSLEQWIDLVKRSGPRDEKEQRAWLKSKFGLGTNTAWWISERANGKGGEDGNPDAYLEAAIQYVDAQYSGSKQALRPIYDALLELGLSLGKDVKACPCKTIVPLYRNHVFAQIKPTARTRIDFGLALGNMKTPKRLIDTGGFEKKDRISRRIPISSLEEIDDEVKKWLKVAYDMDK